MYSWFWTNHDVYLIFIGSGTSKKLAKRNAAAKMLSRIHDVPVDMRSSHEAEAEDDTFNMVRDVRTSE